MSLRSGYTGHVTLTVLGVRRLGSAVRLFKKHFFGKVMLQLTFPVVLLQKMILTNFHKKILMFRECAT